MQWLTSLVVNNVTVLTFLKWACTKVLIHRSRVMVLVRSGAIVGTGSQA